MVLAAVGQLCSRAVVSDNLRRCAHLIRRASALGARIVFLPEASDFIAPSRDYPSLSATLDESSFVRGIRECAKQEKCWVQVGVHERSNDPNKVFNTLLMISDRGEIRQAYRKLHLFDIDFSKTVNANESKYIARGEELLDPVATPVGNVGQLICYDMRFPEVGIMQRSRGADILTYPSAFTMRTGAAHWEVLLRARAIENQCWVVAAAQVGVHMDSPLRQSWGHRYRLPLYDFPALIQLSMIIDPWGTVVAQVPDTLPSTALDAERADEWGTSLALADIDLADLHAIRTSMPVSSQRRHDIYPALR